MKAILTLAAALFAATPALAAPNSNFTGPRIEATAGIADLTRISGSKVTYGATAGVDLPVGSRVTLGAEASLNDVFDRNRTYGAAGRVGVALNDNLLLFGTAGYTKLRSLDGLRVGGGLEISSDLPVYAKVEYRYSDFQHGVGRHEGLVGLGLRF